MTNSAKSRKHIHKKNRKNNPANTNWHIAAVCAIQIDLQEFSHILEFHTEYPLSNKSHRIDLLIIQKLRDEQIPLQMAAIFNKFNLFEIKGLGSALTSDAYYKTIGYACLLIDSHGKTGEFSRNDISLSFLCTRYPRKLFQHLKKKCGLTIEKKAPGIYYIINDIFKIQVLINCELSEEETLFTKALTIPLLCGNRLAENVTEICSRHEGHPLYTTYISQLCFATLKQKGDNTMICEGALRLCGTSSKEIEARVRKEEKAYYTSLLKEKDDLLKEQRKQFKEQSKQMKSQIEYYQQKLISLGIEP